MQHALACKQLLPQHLCSTSIVVKAIQNSELNSPQPKRSPTFVAVLQRKYSYFSLLKKSDGSSEMSKFSVGFFRVLFCVNNAFELAQQDSLCCFYCAHQLLMTTRIIRTLTIQVTVQQTHISKTTNSQIKYGSDMQEVIGTVQLNQCTPTLWLEGCLLPFISLLAILIKR